MQTDTHKEPKTGAEIAAEITRRIYANPDVQSRGARFHIPSAAYQEPDDDGCNWTVNLQRATPGFDSVIAQAVHDARSRYVLKQ